MSGGFVLYANGDDSVHVDVHIEDDTVWLTQAQLVELFQSSKANISEHIKNIFSEGELEQSATVRKFRTVRLEGGREVAREIEHYNLDMIISLGYRVNSKVATSFRIWATKRLNEYKYEKYRQQGVVRLESDFDKVVKLAKEMKK